MAKSQSKSKQAYQTQYKATSRWKSNRVRKLQRQLKLQPNNAAQIEAALANVGNYRRSTPTTPFWSHTMIRTAKLFKQFCGKAPHTLFSSNPQTAAAALQGLRGNVQKNSVPQGKADFSIAAVARVVVLQN